MANPSWNESNPTEQNPGLTSSSRSTQVTATPTQSAALRFDMEQSLELTSSSGSTQVMENPKESTALLFDMSISSLSARSDLAWLKSLSPDILPAQLQLWTAACLAHANVPGPPLPSPSSLSLTALTELNAHASPRSTN